MKRLVLFSSGLDSTIGLYEALKVSGQDANRVKALFFDYGQRASKQELFCATKTCEKLGIELKVISIDWLSHLKGSSLTDFSFEVPKVASENLDSMSHGTQTAKAVWVPNRNGLFVNIAAAIAEANDTQEIVVGFNLEEAKTFPDNSIEFMDALNVSLSYSTLTRVRVMSFTATMRKPEIARRGRELGVDFSMIWPCYHGFEKPCGTCESCQRFIRAVDGVASV